MRFLVVSDNTLTEEVCKEEIYLIQLLNEFRDVIQQETYDSFLLVINYYLDLIQMKNIDRNSELYSLKCIYSLLQLSATHDVAVKEIFLNSISNELIEKTKLNNYIGGVLKGNLANRYFTNIKHDGVKNKLNIKAENVTADIQQCINEINELINTRNSIAHEIIITQKGHNDVRIALVSVLKYLKWYRNELKKKITEESYS